MFSDFLFFLAMFVLGMISGASAMRLYRDASDRKRKDGP